MLKVANPEEKNADHLDPPPPLVLHTEYYPFKRGQVPVGPSVHITRLASNEIFSPSNKIHREVRRAKDLPAPL